MKFTYLPGKDDPATTSALGYKFALNLVTEVPEVDTYAIERLAANPYFRAVKDGEARPMPPQPQAPTSVEQQPPTSNANQAPATPAPVAQQPTSATDKPVQPPQGGRR